MSQKSPNMHYPAARRDLQACSRPSRSDEVVHEWYFVPPLALRVVWIAAVLGAIGASAVLAVKLYYRPHLFWSIVPPVWLWIFLVGRFVEIQSKHYCLTTAGLWMGHTGVFFSTREPPRGHECLVCWDEVAAVMVHRKTLRLQPLPSSTRRRWAWLRRAFHVEDEVSVHIDEAGPEVVDTIRQLVWQRGVEARSLEGPGER